MDSVDPYLILGATLIDPTGKHAVTITSLIGSGSFAHVYLAEETPLTGETATLTAKAAAATLALSHAQSVSQKGGSGTISGSTLKTQQTAPVTSPSSSSVLPEKRAVKRLFKAGLTEAQLALQKREAEIMKAIEPHQNVVRLLATVEDDECLYLIMEYCDLGMYGDSGRERGLLFCVGEES